MKVDAETIASGLALPETPVLEHDGSWLLAEMGAGQGVWRASLPSAGR